MAILEMLDIKTLVFFDALICFFLGVGLQFYSTQERIYAGFQYWVWSCYAICLGYFSLLARGLIPDWLSIVLVNFLFIFGMVMRVDGVNRFLRNKPLPPFIYLTAPVTAMLALYFFLISDQMQIRTLIIAIAFFTVSTLGAQRFFHGARTSQGGLYLATATLYFCGGAVLLLYAIFLLIYPETGLFQASYFQSTYFLTIMMIDMGTVFSFMMLTNKRVNAELNASNLKLQETLSDLEQSMANVQSLSGLLPICASCKNIRDDRGYWSQIESYISKHSQAEFSHGICPDCAVKLYPDVRDTVQLKE